MERHVLHASFRVRVRASRASATSIFGREDRSIFGEWRFPVRRGGAVSVWQRGPASFARSPAFTAHGGAVVSNAWGSIFA